eukprot:s996_g30.t1
MKSELTIRSFFPASPNFQTYGVACAAASWQQPQATDGKDGKGTQKGGFKGGEGMGGSPHGPPTTEEKPSEAAEDDEEGQEAEEGDEEAFIVAGHIVPELRGLTGEQAAAVLKAAADVPYED